MEAEAFRDLLLRLKYASGWTYVEMSTRLDVRPDTLAAWCRGDSGAMHRRATRAQVGRQALELLRSVRGAELTARRREMLAAWHAWLLTHPEPQEIAEALHAIESALRACGRGGADASHSDTASRSLRG